MKSSTLKAIVFTSILSALVLCLNLVVGAQQHSKEHMGTDQTDKSKSDKDKKNSSNMGASGALSSSDRKFVIEAAEGGMMEVRIGRMGVERATNESVKQFSQRIIDDHSKANQELMQLAQQKGIVLPAHLLNESDHGATQSSAGSGANTTGTTVNTSTSGTTGGSNTKATRSGDSDHQKMSNKLSRLSGADFDRAYMREQVKHHEKAVSMFEKESMKGKDPDVKSWAAATLPTLREHLRMARELNNSVSGKTASNTR